MGHSLVSYHIIGYRGHPGIYENWPPPPLGHHLDRVDRQVRPVDRQVRLVDRQVRLVDRQVRLVHRTQVRFVDRQVRFVDWTQVRFVKRVDRPGPIVLIVSFSEL